MRRLVVVLFAMVCRTGCGLFPKAPQACLGGPGTPVGASPFEPAQGCDPTP